ncbi:MAG: hypothetical protein ACOYO9_12010 [Candidatus Nanopelagicales bacterium]|jgi:hypothetical protein
MARDRVGSGTRSVHCVVAAIALAASAVLLAGCGAQDTSAPPSREAGMYRDSQLCVRNLTSDSIDLGPGKSTVGEFVTLSPNGRACFASNNTAEAAATVSLLLPDDSTVLAGAENYMIGKPDFRLCVSGPDSNDSCARSSYEEYGQGTVLNEQSLSIGSVGQSVSIEGHSYLPRRLADSQLYIVYEMDVLS